MKTRVLKLLADLPQRIHCPAALFCAVLLLFFALSAAVGNVSGSSRTAASGTDVVSPNKLTREDGNQGKVWAENLLSNAPHLYRNCSSRRQNRSDFHDCDNYAGEPEPFCYQIAVEVVPEKYFTQTSLCRALQLCFSLFVRDGPDKRLFC